MRQDWKAEISRRPVLSGILAALGIALVGSFAYEAPRWSRHRYKPSPYDDLLEKLPERDNAGRIGAAFIAETPGFNAESTARALRTKLAAISLAEAMSADLAQDRLVEVRGWVLPGTLSDLCALAAKAV
jgi:hypothetical protein